MNRIITVLTGLFIFCFSSAQEWQALDFISSDNNIEINDLARDEFNNVYIAVEFENSLSFSDTTINSTGGKDVFIAKYNENLELVWFTTVTGTKFQFQPTLDVNDNLIIALSTNDTTYYGNNSFAVTNDLNVIKIEYDLDGNALNASFPVFGPGFQYVSDLKISSANDYILTGYAWSSDTTFLSDSFFLLSRSGNIQTPFIAKYSSNDSLLWAKNYEVSTNAKIRNIKIFQDYTYINGHFRDSIYFDNEDHNSLNNSNDLFLIQLNSKNGDDAWIRRTYGNSDDYAGTISIDNYRNIYYSGYYQSDPFLVDSAETNISEDSAFIRGYYDLYVHKYDSSGNLIWKKDYGSNGKDFTLNVLAKNNSLFLAGYYSDSLIFGKDTLPKTNGVEDYAILLGGFDLQGNMIAGCGINGSDANQDAATVLQVDNNNNVFTGGYFASASITIGDSTFANPNPGTKALWLGKYKPCFEVSIVDHQNISCYGANDGTLTAKGYFGVLPYKYNWSNGDTTQTADSLTPGKYTVTITDALDSTVTVTSDSITEPVSLTITDTVFTPITCPGGADGGIDITVQGGTMPYNFNWGSTTGDDQDVEDQTGISAGTYTLTLTDKNGCQLTEAYKITDPLDISFDGTTVTDVTPGDSTDGAIDLAVSGGTGLPSSFTYTWQGPDSYTSNDADIDSLRAGQYDLTVEDVNSCIADTFFIVKDTAFFMAYISSKKDVSCKYFDDGNAVVSITKSQGPVNYSWKNSLGNEVDTDSVLSNVPSGTYWVTVYDAGLNKSDFTEVTITQPATSLNASIDSVQDELCFGAENGFIAISASGGEGPYNYMWNTSDTTQDIANLPDGFYSVTVTDSRECQEIISGIQIRTWDLLTADIQINKPISCNGDTDGELQAIGDGGNPGYTYEWDDPLNVAQQTVNNIAEGTFTVTVTDQNGCTASETINISDPDELLVTKTIKNVTCKGLANGEAELNITGGSQPYTVLWYDNGSNFATGQHITALSAGKYYDTITDANGCTTNDSIIVTEPEYLVISDDSVTNVSCAGAKTGAINIEVTGGVPPYGFNWNSPNGGGHVASDSNQVNLFAATYDVTITDQNNCQVFGSYTVNEPNTVKFDGTVITDVTPGDSADGAIDLTISGGTGNPLGFDFSWNGPDAFTSIEQDIDSLVAGEYTVTVTDDNGCQFDTTLFVNDSSSFIAYISSVKKISCKGETDAEATVSVSNGTPPFAYKWENSSGIEISNNQTATGLSKGLYYVTVLENVSGRTDFTTINITEPSQGLNASIQELVNEQCHEDSSGFINLNVTGGEAPYQYNWSNGDTTQTATGLTKGYYNVTVTDARGCTDQVTNIYIDSWQQLIPEIIVSDSISCNGKTDGSLTANAYGGNGPSYTYDWNTLEQQQSITGLGQGVYKLTVTDENGCTAIDSITLNDPDSLKYNMLVSDISCNNANDGEIDMTVNGGTRPYTSRWYKAGNYITTALNIKNLSPGIYTDTLVDANGCMITRDVRISEPPALTFLSDSVTDVSCANSQDGGIDISIDGGTLPYNYLWQGTGTGYGLHDSDQVAISAGTYDVTVSDANGCQRTRNYVVEEPEPIVFTGTTITDVTPGDSTDGGIDLKVSGGAGVFTVFDYNWEGPDGFTAIEQDIDSLKAGEYLVTVTDTNGCTANSSFIVRDTSTFMAYISNVQHVSCKSGYDGEATAYVVNTTGSVSYNWENSSGTKISTDSTASSLSAGNYYVTVTDMGSGKTDIKSVNITEPSNEFLANINETGNELCNNDSTGYIDINVVGGSLPYTYNWSNGNTTQDALNLSDGYYAVTITDSRGCAKIISNIQIKGWDQLVADINVVQSISCVNSNDAILEATGAGGSKPYKYNWNINETTEQIQDLQAGTYKLTLTDDNGCTSTDSISINDPASISVNKLVKNVVCPNDLNGEIGLTISGGTKPYNHKWYRNGSFYSQFSTNENASLSNLSAGVYVDSITDNNGCRKVIATQLTSQSPIKIVSQNVQSNLLCKGDSAGVITLVVSGGNPPLNYSLVPANLPLGNTGNFDEQIGLDTFRVVLDSLPAANYSVDVSDSENCGPVSVSNLLVKEPASITTNVITDDISCSGKSDGAIVVNASGGTGQLSYKLIPGGDSNTSGTFSDLEAGIYKVALSDTNNCTDTTTVTEISAPDVITIDSTDVTQTSSAQASDGSINVFASGGTGNLIYTLSPGSKENANGIFNSLSADTYIVYVTDQNSCGPVQSNPLTVEAGSFIHLVTEKITINIYPVPADDELYIEIGSETEDKVDILIENNQGRGVYGSELAITDEITSKYIDVSGFPSGIYFITVRGDNLFEREKILILE